VVAACVSLGGDVRAFGQGHDGAIVTSTDGRAIHPGLTAVVVTDRSTVRAEVLAKAAFVAGRAQGADLLARFGVDGWFLPHQTPLDTAA
jgi:thiamine biosynthesis lipoprotein ApbE